MSRAAVVGFSENPPPYVGGYTQKDPDRNRKPIHMTKLCDINPAAREKLPPNFNDKSGIGVHYTDAFIKPMNVKLPDGTRVSCKRKGLKIILAAGTKKGEGLMRRLDVSKDPVAMLDAALQDAAKTAGLELKITDKEILVDGIATFPAAPAA